MAVSRGNRAPVYADHNATTPMRPEAVTAMSEVAAEVGNPSSVHALGRAARTRLEAARRQVAGLLGARTEEVIFTSGGTEADLLALKGSGRERVMISAVEHDAVLRAMPEAERVPVTGDGVVDLEALRERLEATAAPALVSVMWANNETGAVQPIAKVVALAREFGALVHSDAVQAAGKVVVDFSKSGLDMMSVSAHKIGGPAGVGALILREGVGFPAAPSGGGQERGRRAGTENLAGIAAFGAAAAAIGPVDREAARVTVVRDRFEARILAEAPEARIFSRGVARLPNTTCVWMPDMAAETQVMALDLDGMAVSAGAACSSGKVTASHVLLAMGVDDAAARGAIRVSWGWSSTEGDADRLAEAWLALYKRAVETG